MNRVGGVQSVGALMTTAIAALTNPDPRKVCPTCGTPYKLIGSKTKVQTEITWKALLTDELCIPAPQFTSILELITVEVLIKDIIQETTTRVILEPEVHAYAQESVILTNHEQINPNDLTIVTARVEMPSVVILAPHDKCCSSRALDLGRKLQASKGNTEENQRVRSYGAYLIAWGKDQENNLLEPVPPRSHHTQSHAQMEFA
jgi:hypothetical protein